MNYSGARTTRETPTLFIFILAVLACVLALLFAGSSAQAQIIPEQHRGGGGLCVSGNLLVWNLDTESTDALQEVIPGLFDTSLRFTTTTQLLMISIGDVMRIGQTALLPTGLSGEVENIVAGGGELTFTVTQTRTPGRVNPADIGAAQQFTLEPSDSMGNPVCEHSVPGEDADNDGFPDHGDVDGECTGQGGEQAFRMQLVEGVEISGVLSVSGFEMAGSAVMEDQINLDNVVQFGISAKSRISFTGEISAMVDYEFNGDPIFSGSFPIVDLILNVGGVGTINVSLGATAFVGTEGFIKAGSKAGFSATAEAEMALNWVDGFAPQVTTYPAEFDLQISPPELNEDAAACFTLYGGATVTLATDLTYGGVIPITGNEIQVTARGLVNASVVPALDPWWTIAGKSEVYVDVVPHLLLANLSSYNFTIVDTDPVVFFSSDNEFPVRSTASTETGMRSAGDAVRWSRVYQHDESVELAKAIPTPDGGAIAIGLTTADNGVLMKTDREGQRLWQRRLEGSFTPESIVQLADDSYVVAGRRITDLWLAGFSPTGALLWSREYDLAEGTVNPVQLSLSSSNTGLYVSGSFAGGAPIEAIPFVVRLTTDGTLVWSRAFGQSGENDPIYGAHATSDDGVILVGTTTYDVGPTVGNNSLTARFAADGTLAWANVFATRNTDALYDVTQLADGGYVAVGRSSGSILDEGPRGFIVRYDADDLMAPTEPRYHQMVAGDLDKTDTLFDQLNSVSASDNGFFVAGSSLSGTAQTGWVAKLIESGNSANTVWSMFYDGVDEDHIGNVYDLGDGLLVAGDSRSFGPGLPGDTNSIWLSRLPYDGNMHWNADAPATAEYRHNINEVGPLYPAFLGDWRSVYSEDVTAVQGNTGMNFTTSNSTLLIVQPDGYLQKELVRAPLPFIDLDADSYPDDTDNCLDVANFDQRDTNGDGFGNACDPDLNNDGLVNFADVSLFAAVFLSADADADFNGDGAVNFLDYTVLVNAFLSTPGPSAIAP